MRSLFLASVLVFTTTSNAIKYRTGDLIFQTSKSIQSSAIFEATDSPFTHVGIIQADGNRYSVFEAVNPARKIDLSAFIQKGLDSKYAIYRFQNLTPSMEKLIARAALFYIGRPYDIYFTLVDDGARLYCSEFVERVFKDAKIQVGLRQKIRDLNLNANSVQALIGASWRGHPSCFGLANVDQCLKVVLAEEIITPVGLLNRSQLTLIESNY